MELLGEGAKGQWALTPFPQTPTPNPLWEKTAGEAGADGPGFPSQLLRVGRGVWGEGRDFKSLALPPQYTIPPR